MKKLAAFVVSVIGAWCAVAVDYPVITIETDEGTLAAPVRLDEMNVSVVASDGAAAETVSFASLGKPTTGTLRKRGTGFVMSSFNMTNFTGTVLIEEGAMCCEGPGSFGPPNNTAGAMVISNGASLVVAGHKETMVKYGMQIWNPISLEGTGVDGLGAIYNKTIDVTSRQALKGGLTFRGDTLIGSESEYELGDVTGHPYQLNGHTLTLRGGKGMLLSDAVVEPGHIVITNDSTIRIQTGFTLKGGATNVLRVCSDASFAPYNGGSFSAPWTLLLEDDASVNMTGSDGDSKIANLARHQWKGPIQVNGTVNINGDSHEGFSALGPVTGVGGFKVIRGHLNLTNELNDFRGPVVVRPTKAERVAALGLWKPNAWPQANEHPLVATNATLYFGTFTNYNLPRVLWHNVTSYTNSRAYGTPTYLVTPGIVKTGDGTLALPGQLTATNRTELRGGTLRLAPPVSTQYSLNPGVWESVKKWSKASLEDGTKENYYTNGTLADTNGVENALRYCQKTGKSSTEPSWDDGNGNSGYQVARYEGYLWNRSSETQRWSLAMATIFGKLYLDDEIVIKQESTWYYLATNTIAVAPSPHKFDIRYWNSAYGTGGAKPAYFIENGLTGKKMTVIDPVGGTNVYEKLPETWPNNFGFGIDVQGRSSLFSADYVKPENGTGAFGFSDGVWFTTTTNSVEQAIVDGSFVAAHLRSSFATLAATAGTTLDLGGGDVCVQDFEGFTHVTNGTLRIAGTWTLDAAAAVGGAKLVADDEAKILFAPGAQIDVDNLAAWRGRGAPRTIIDSDAIEGAPILSSALQTLGARLEKGATGWKLLVPSSGTTVIVR